LMSVPLKCCRLEGRRGCRPNKAEWHSNLKKNE
jgi:hypothetical protein